MKTKLFKLLYLLDFEHFKKTGKSVTGLSYEAWKLGPVPVSLFHELKEPEPDMTSKLLFEMDDLEDAFQIIPKSDFDLSLFTKRELDLLANISDKYKFSSANDLIDLTHQEGLPWKKTLDSKGKNAVIDYELILEESGAIPKEHLKLIREEESERQAFQRALSH